MSEQTTTIAAAYIAAAANRHNHVASASSSSLLAFGSSNFVALWDTTDTHDRGVFATLHAHEGLVTAVQFLSEDTLVSADDKGVLVIWRKSGSKWEPNKIIRAHDKAISVLVTWNDTLVTGASDSTVKVWRIVSFDLEHTQTISLRGRYPLSAALAELPNSTAAILAIGVTARDPLIFTRSDAQFVQSASLPGHEDWIRALSFQKHGNSLVLASGSQDSTIRLWNIEPAAKHTSKELTDELLDTFEAALGDLADTEEGGKQISLKRHMLTVKSGQSTTQFSITFDALLIGHEAGVTSLSWRSESNMLAKPTLLSTSTDSSIILWSPSSISTSAHETTSIWINRQRFGDVGGQRLGGFVGGLWIFDGRQILAHGWAGGWRRWQCQSSPDVPVDEEVWVELPAISGHYGPVKDVSWSPEGEYIISAGLDQTTRIHGPIPQSDVSSSWHELGRPQVHGYDLVGVSFLSPLQFVSVADEKVARVFEASKAFVDVVESLAVCKFKPEEHDRPETANVPPLGLSNKATSASDATVPSAAASSHRRPFDGELAGSTLWPETEKVFGHGYESITVAVSNNKSLVATTCKASTTEHAVTRIHDTKSWQPFGKPLEGHNLTVTRVAFSPDDTLVLTVSRDRTWRLFELRGNDGYFPVAADKSHARIIWDCSWSVSGQAFATASRDKSVKIWQQNEEQKWVAVHTIKCAEAATAVSFAPSARDDDRQHIAVGLETGEILIYSSPSSSYTEWKVTQTIPRGEAHADHIHRIAWKPNEFSQTRHIASCSEDGTLKVSIFRGT